MLGSLREKQQPILTPLHVDLSPVVTLAKRERGRLDASTYPFPHLSQGQALCEHQGTS